MSDENQFLTKKEVSEHIKDFMADAADLIGASYATMLVIKAQYPSTTAAWTQKYEAFKTKWQIPDMP